MDNRPKAQNKTQLKLKPKQLVNLKQLLMGYHEPKLK
jgi:hypothetical protein